MQSVRILAVLRVLRKEVREAMRDRNLVLQLVLVPLFLYPLLAFGAIQVFSLVRGAEEQKETVLWIDADAPSHFAESLSERPRTRVVATPPTLDAPGRGPDAAEVRRLRDEWPADADSEAPLALLAAWSTAGVDSFAVYYDASRDRSGDARDLLSGMLEDHRDSLVAVRAGEVGMGEDDLALFDRQTENTATAQDMGRMILSMMLPIYLMFMLAQGAYYAALDTVVGERERGTLETLLSSPLSRSEIMAGKFLYVTFSAGLTFVLNMTSLLLFATYAIKLFDLPVDLSFSIPLPSVLLMLLTAILAGALLSALMMFVCVPAKHYREGTAALSPVYMVAGFASFAVIFAPQEFSVVHAMIPFVNVAALCRAALGGYLETLPVLVTLGVLAGLSAVAVGLAARAAAGESALFDPDIKLSRLLKEALRS